jgi:hypothetical protein
MGEEGEEGEEGGSGARVKVLQYRKIFDAPSFREMLFPQILGPLQS